MGAVYSSRIYSGGPMSHGSIVGLYSPDSAHVLVVRDIEVENTINLWNPLDGFWFGDNGGVHIWKRHYDLVAQRTYSWRGRQVIEPGDSLNFFTIDADWYVRVSGYLLTLP